VPNVVTPVRDPSQKAMALRRELANSLTHGIGILFGVASIPVLSAVAARVDNVPGIVGATIYAFCLLMVFTFSTLYHGMQHPVVKRVLKIFDHISIFFLIAGTYTPFLLTFMLDAFGIAMLSILWSLVLIGMVFKIFFTGRFKVVSTAIYVIMGWMLLFGGKRFFEVLPVPVMVMLIIGGGLYTLGTIFYLAKRLPYHHAIWHLFVLSAAVCHYVAVLLAVTAPILK
jgi:hemolysin III